MISCTRGADSLATRRSQKSEWGGGSGGGSQAARDAASCSITPRICGGGQDRGRKEDEAEPRFHRRSKALVTEGGVGGEGKLQRRASNGWGCYFVTKDAHAAAPRRRKQRRALCTSEPLCSIPRRVQTLHTCDYDAIGVAGHTTCSWREFQPVRGPIQLRGHVTNICHVVCWEKACELLTSEKRVRGVGGAERVVRNYRKKSHLS